MSLNDPELLPPTHTGFMERKGKLEEMDRSFDLKFWQAQDDTARFAAFVDLLDGV